MKNIIFLLLITLAACSKEEAPQNYLHLITTTTCDDINYTVTDIKSYHTHSCIHHRDIARSNYPEHAHFHYQDKIYNRDQIIICSHKPIGNTHRR